MSRRPPLPLSPRRLRPRRVVVPEISCRTLPVSSARKAQSRDRSFMEGDQPHLYHSGYEAITTELLTLAKRVSNEFGPGSGGSPLEQLSSPGPPPGVNSSERSPPMFHRGKMYEMYSERRNERLRRREERKDWELGISGGSEVAKRRVTVKRPPSAAGTATKTARTSVEAGDVSAVRGVDSQGSSVKAPTLSFALSSCAAAAAEAAPRASAPGISRLTNPRRSLGCGEKKLGTRSCRKK